MSKSTMTARERVIAAIEHRQPDRVPRYDAFWEDTVAKYIADGLKLPPQRQVMVDGQVKKLGSPIEEYFNFDLQCLYMDVSMRFPSRLVSDDGTMIVVEDQCGYTAQKFKGKASSLHFLSHKINDQADWERYRHRFAFNPQDTARVDCEGYFFRTKPYPSWDGIRTIYDAMRANGKYLAVVGYGPFEATWRHHGFENCLMDIVCEPDLMMDMFDKAATVVIDTLAHLIKLGMKPDGMWLIEDMGGTHTTLFSPDTYRTCLLPYHKKVGTFLKANGIHFLMHSCGKIESLLPDLIDAGLDVIQALQVNTGMDVVDLKARFGDKLTFFGNIGEQTFAQGKDAIEAELRRKIPVAAAGGGYIYHSDHSIPPEVELATYRHAMHILDEIGVYP